MITLSFKRSEIVVSLDSGIATLKIPSFIVDREDVWAFCASRIHPEGGDVDAVWIRDDAPTDAVVVRGLRDSEASIVGSSALALGMGAALVWGRSIVIKRSHPQDSMMPHLIQLSNDLLFLYRDKGQADALDGIVSCLPPGNQSTIRGVLSVGPTNSSWIR